MHVANIMGQLTVANIKLLRDPTCDVLCTSQIIQDGGQFS